MKPKLLFCPLIVSIFCLFLSQNVLSSALTISIPNGQWWDLVRQGNGNLATQLPLGAPAKALKNLAEVRENMLSQAKTRFTVGLIPSNEVNAFARKEAGYTLIIFTSGFLLRFGNDADVLATTLGHELAHHLLGHTNANLENDAKPVYMLANLPNQNNLSSPQNRSQQKTLEEIQNNERAADLAGIEWAVKAGYSACGSYRLAEGLAEIEKNPLSSQYLSTHPTNSERMAIAQNFGAEHNRPASCMASQVAVPAPTPVPSELPTILSEPLLPEALPPSFGFPRNPFLFG